MSDYFDFHKKNIFIRKFIRALIQFANILPKKLFIYFWNALLALIKNSVRISLTHNNTFLITDKYTSIEICYKNRFEYYLQNIHTRLNHLNYEYMLNQIKFVKNDVVIDCGANIGELYRSILHLTKDDINLNYYGFEPVKLDFEVLSRNTTNLVPKALALSSESVSKNFYLNPNSADSSFERKGYLKEVKVECVTIDNYFKNIDSIKLLKLEAEGFELDVLIGAQKSLSKIKFITADLGFELQRDTVRSFEEVDRFLTKNNFKRLSSTKRETYLYINQREIAGIVS
jgi:FkbM family methyltransferase